MWPRGAGAPRRGDRIGDLQLDPSWVSLSITFGYKASVHTRTFCHWECSQYKRVRSAKAMYLNHL
jgi:hypothetical protein